MNISLDFDDTYTRDPEAWDKFIKIMRDAGHKVYCVTMRNGEDPWEMIEVWEALNGKVNAVYGTNRDSKKEFMAGHGIWIDVWIDDNPYFCENNAWREDR